MCAINFDIEAMQTVVDTLQRKSVMSRQPKLSHGKEWLRRKHSFSKTCPAILWTGFSQRQLDGELSDTTHQDVVNLLDEMRSHRSTTVSQSSCANKMYDLRVGSEILGSDSEDTTWISLSRDHEHSVDDIFAMATCNKMCAHETVESVYPICQRRGASSANCKQSLSSLDFDVLNHSADELIEICLEIFIGLEIDKELEFSRDALHTFIRHARNQMNDNPYHNWFHVVDVVQSLYSIGIQCGAWNTMSSKEKFALLAAALCHDLDHPGFNNAFIDKTKSIPSSQPGFPTSCLEEHHSLKATELMTSPDGTGLLDSLDPKDKLDILERTEAIILATDMGRHGQYMSHLKEVIENRQQDTPACDAFDQEERRLVAEVLIKCADMGNVLRPFPVAKKWAVRITEEFFLQGDLERTLGVELSPMCDRSRNSLVGLQKGFVGFVAPFYEAVARLLPSLRPLLNRLDATRAGWETYVSDEAMLASVSRDGQSTSCESPG